MVVVVSGQNESQHVYFPNTQFRLDIYAIYKMENVFQPSAGC